MKICVIGAGVLGVTTAYELARSGHQVSVIERRSEPGRECSFANGGQLSYSHSEPWANPHVFPKLWKWMWQDDAPLVLRFNGDPHMIRWGLLFLYNCLPSRADRHNEVMLRLGLYSKRMMAELRAATNVEFSYRSDGILHVFDDQNEFDHAKRLSEFQHARGCEETVLTREQAIAMEPSLGYSARPLVGAVHASMDESGDIHVFTKNLAAYLASRHNVQFLYNRSLARIHKSQGKVSHLEFVGGEYLSGFDAYVMCAGASSPIYLRQLGLHVPIYPMKGYSITFNASEYTPSVSITDSGRKQVYSRLGDKVRLAGTAEFAGYNDSVRKARIEPLVRGAEGLFPKADLTGYTEWACLRPSTPDGPPIIGATPISNLYINSGHGTLGWTQAAGSARLLADVVNGKPTEIPLSGLDIERCLIKL